MYRKNKIALLSLMILLLVVSSTPVLATESSGQTETKVLVKTFELSALYKTDYDTDMLLTPFFNLVIYKFQVQIYGYYYSGRDYFYRVECYSTAVTAFGYTCTNLVVKHGSDTFLYTHNYAWNAIYDPVHVEGAYVSIECDLYAAGTFDHHVYVVAAIVL